MKKNNMSFSLNIILCTIFSLFFSELNGNTPNSSFIALGHAHSVIQTSIQRENFIKHINSDSVDYVFILGDSELYNKDIVDQYRKKLDAQVFFSPGNHDIIKNFSEISIENYFNSVGYLDTLIITDKFNFIVLNSSENKNNINNFLHSIKKK
jgi:hypothetical protein